MLCTHCHKTFGVDSLKAQRGKGVNAQIQCPHCQAWLGRSVLLTLLKIGSFYLTVAVLLGGYFASDLRYITTPIAVIATITLLISHMMDQLKVMQAPEMTPIDDSTHRQKYR